ncbi:MAG: dethiobiotin synthase, partial [Oceanospirillum sp.]|nr:dethiobiotin synthase [Oceanospirillum sp.]
YEMVNPIALEPAIAPHIAAQEAGSQLSVSRSAGFARGIMMARADLLLIEGAGGWRVPLNSRETLADLAKNLKQPVILVVGMKLGCINHALLTAEAIKADGLEIAGWIANKIDPDMNRYQENLATLAQLIQAPLLAEIPYMENSDWKAAAAHIPEPAVRYLIEEQ